MSTVYDKVTSCAFINSPVINERLISVLMSVCLEDLENGFTKCPRTGTSPVLDFFFGFFSL